MAGTRLRFTLLVVFAVCIVAPGLSAQSNEASARSVMNSVAWVKYPKRGTLGDIASITIPRDYVFAGTKDTQRLMEMMGNPVSGAELGFLAPKDLSFFLVFEYRDSGHVSDTDSESLNPDAILTSIRQGNDEANKERARRGWSSLNIVGWQQKPSYSRSSNNLTWAIRASGSDGEVINYNTRLLGREGVMEVAMVVEPVYFAQTVPTTNLLLRNYSFNEGQRYAEYRDGDKLAKYGLAALITGGGVAVAAKTGLLAKVFKLILKLGVFIIAAIGGLVRKLTRKKPVAPYPTKSNVYGR